MKNLSDMMTEGKVPFGLSVDMPEGATCLFIDNTMNAIQYYKKISDIVSVIQDDDALADEVAKVKKVTEVGECAVLGNGDYFVAKFA